MASALQHLRAIGLRPVKNQSHGLSSDGDYASYECYDSADPGPSIPLSKAIKHKPKESFENVWSVSHGFNPPGHTDTSWASSISPSANFQSTFACSASLPPGHTEASWTSSSSSSGYKCADVAGSKVDTELVEQDKSIAELAAVETQTSAPQETKLSNKQIKSAKEKAKKEGGNVPAEPEKEMTPEEQAEARKKQMKKVIKEGGKRGVEIEGAADMGGLQFFCTSVDEPEGDLDLLDLCMTSMNAKSDPSEEERKGGSGHVGKMIFSAGTDQLSLLAYIPDEKASEIDARDWMKHVVNLFQGEHVEEGSTGVLCRGFIKADTNVNKFPLKMKEPCITEAISYLKKKGLFPDKDDDSDDDYVFGDDDFPSM